MKSLILAASLTALSALTAQASILITYAEQANDNTSSLANTEVFTFDNLSNGRNTNVQWAGVGTFDQLFVKNADIYGGAANTANPNGTKYSLQGAGQSVTTSTLALSQASAYFGFWWSAGDARNVLNFYNGNTLVSQFTTASLMDPLPGSYDGNPRNRSWNSGEPYGFINFYGDENTVWDRIVLSQSGGGGFESDNYTTRVAGWNPLTDGALGGVVVASVTGTTTTRVTAADLTTTRWALNENTAPGAPLPPWSLLGIFALIVGAKKARAAKTAA